MTRALLALAGPAVVVAAIAAPFFAATALAGTAATCTAYYDNCLFAGSVEVPPTWRCAPDGLRLRLPLDPDGDDPCPVPPLQVFPPCPPPPSPPPQPWPPPSPSPPPMFSPPPPSPPPSVPHTPPPPPPRHTSPPVAIRPAVAIPAVAPVIRIARPRPRPRPRAAHKPAATPRFAVQLPPPAQFKPGRPVMPLSVLVTVVLTPCVITMVARLGRAITNRR